MKYAQGDLEQPYVFLASPDRSGRSLEPLLSLRSWRTVLKDTGMEDIASCGLSSDSQLPRMGGCGDQASQSESQPMRQPVPALPFKLVQASPSASISPSEKLS